jgi:hypothetical protein
MRLAIIIVALTAIAVTLIHLRRGELAMACETQRLQMEQVTLRRTMWDQQVRLGRLLAPPEVKRRSEEMALDMVVPNPTQKRMVTGIARSPDRR